MLEYVLPFDLMNTLYKLVNLHYLKVMYALISNSKLASKLHADTSPSTSQPPLLIHPEILKSMIICYSRISLIKSSFIDPSLPSLSLPTTYSWISPPLFQEIIEKHIVSVFCFSMSHQICIHFCQNIICKKCNACRSSVRNLNSK